MKVCLWMPHLARILYEGNFSLVLEAQIQVVMQNERSLKPHGCELLQRGFKCNGACVKSKISGTVIQLQGDQRERARDFMLEYKIVSKSEAIVMHGG